MVGRQPEHAHEEVSASGHCSQLGRSDTHQKEEGCVQTDDCERHLQRLRNEPKDESNYLFERQDHEGKEDMSEHSFVKEGFGDEHANDIEQLCSLAVKLVRKERINRYGTHATS